MMEYFYICAPKRKAWGSFFQLEMPDSIKVVRQILVLFVQVRILVGQLNIVPIARCLDSNRCFAFFLK